VNVSELKINKFLNFKYLVILNVIFLCIGLAISVLGVDNYNSVEDYRIAENIAKGIGFVHVEHLGFTSVKAPIYPYICAFFIKLFPNDSKFAIVLFNHLSKFFIPIMFALALKTFNKEKVGLIAGFLFILHPSYLFYPNVIEPTNLFILSCLAWLNFYSRSSVANSKLDIINSGIFGGLTILIQPIALPIILLAHLFKITSGKKYILSLVVILMVLIPWTIRNYDVHGKFVLIKSPMWFNFYYGYKEEMTETNKFDIISKEDTDKIDSLRNVIDDVSMEKHYKEAFIKATAANPEVYIERVAFNFINYWTFVPRYRDNYSLSFLIVRRIPVYLLNFLFIFSCFALFKSFTKELVATLIPIAYFTFIYSIFYASNIRYKLDIEWVQLILIGYAANHYIEKHREINKQI